MRPFFRLKADDLVKSRKTPFFVIPSRIGVRDDGQAGIQFFQLVTEFLDSGFHRSVDFLRMHQSSRAEVEEISYTFSFQL